MAEHIYLGTVQGVRQLTTSALGGTFAATDTCIATVADGENAEVSVIVTATQTMTPTEMAAAMVAAINASDKDTDITGLAETRNIGGYETGQFQDIIASNTGASLECLGSVPGRPFTVDFAATGTGTAGAGSEDVVATGPNHTDNASNWIGGLPGSGDTAIFNEEMQADMLYALGDFTNLDVVIKTGSCTKNIGLAPINIDWGATYSYPEYRTPRFFNVVKASSGGIVRIGDGTGSSASRTCINNGAQTTYYYINDRAPVTNGRNPIEIVSTSGGMEVYTVNGNVDIGDREGVVGAQVEHVRVGAGNTRIQGTIVAASELVINGGTTESHQALTNFTLALEVNNKGKLIQMDGACPAIILKGGILDYRSDGTLTSATLTEKATITFDQDNRTRIVSEYISMDAGCTLRDTRGTATPLMYKFIGCQPNDCKLFLPDDYNITSAVAGMCEGTPSTTVIQTDLDEIRDDFYNGQTLLMTSGSAEDEATVISDYVGATGTLTVSAITAPAATDTFIIV